MARTNKKSRIKGIPARYQLQTKDCGIVSGVFWNDNNSISFTATASLNAGYYLQSGSAWYGSGSEATTSMIMSGSVLKSSVDSSPISFFATRSNPAFNDSNNPAADGKSYGRSFYATGSAENLVGQGFSQPVWSKTKIEIDISSVNMRPAEFAITQSNNATFNAGTVVQKDMIALGGLSNPMLYYNFVAKLWEPIGQRIPVGNDSYYNGTANMFASGTIGFTAGLGFDANYVIKALRGTVTDYNVGKTSLLMRASSSLQCTNLEYFDKMGRVTDNYAFPYGPQYHATSSQTLKMSSYITRPFLAEKIVVVMSGVNYTVFDTIKSNGLYPEQGVIFPFAKNNFFILNQRKNRKFTYTPQYKTEYAGSGHVEINKNISVPAMKSLSVSASETYVNTNRDIITFGAITSFTNDFTSSYTRYLVPNASYNPSFVVPNDVTSSMTYIRFPLNAATNADLVAANNEVITQSYYLQNFLAEDVMIQTSRSLATSRMSALGFASASFVMELPVRSPNVYPNGGFIDPLFSVQTDTLLYDTCDIERGGRNMLGLTNISGRDMLNGYGTTIVGNEYYGLGVVNAGISVNSFTSDIVGLTTNTEYPYTYSTFVIGGGLYSYAPLFKDATDISKLKQNYTKVNPYVLMPEDELIVGWQQPIPNVLELNTYLSMSISGTFTGGGNVLANARSYVTGVIPNTTTAVSGAGIVHISSLQINGQAKIIIYGSEVAYGQEYHDSSNVILNSTALHTVIG